MKLHCPHCGVKGSADDSYLGRKVKCPKCQGVFEVADDSSAEHHKNVAPLFASTATPVPSSLPGQEDAPPVSEDDALEELEPVAALSADATEEILDFTDDDAESEPAVVPPAGQSVIDDDSFNLDDIAAEIEMQIAAGEPAVEPEEIPDDSPVDVSSLQDEFDQSPADETVAPEIAAIAGNYTKKVIEDEVQLVEEVNEIGSEPIDVDNSAKTADATDISEAGIGDAGLVDTGFSIGSVLSESWEKTKGAKGTIWAGSAIMYLVLMVIAAVGYFLVPTVDSDPTNMTGGIGNVVLQSLTSILSILFTAGLFYMGIRRGAGDHINWQMIFQGFSSAGKIIVATILQTILIAIGFILLVLPGIYLTIGYAMTIPLIVDRGMSPWQAMEKSRKSVHKVWWKVAGLFIVIGLLYCVALIPLGIGLIWVWPMLIILFGVLYRHLFGTEEKTE